MTRLTGREIADEQLDGWCHLLGALRTRVRTGDFATGLAVVNAIGAAAEDMGHHPELTLRHDHVDVRLTSHDERGVTARDVRLARAVSAVAVGAGTPLGIEGVTALEFALDTPDHEAVLPFWAAVLGTPPAEGPAGEVCDPSGSLPSLWFQKSGGEEPRQHWHPDVWLDPAQVRPRIDAALAAGGTLVSEADAPRFWVLADPDGNKVCLCTSQERG